MDVTADGQTEHWRHNHRILGEGSRFLPDGDRVHADAVDQQ